VTKIAPHVFLIVALVCNALANILIKYTMSKSPDPGAATSLVSRLSAFVNPIYILAIFLFGMNLLAYSVALKTLRISVAYPIMVSGGYLIILLAGWFIFHERLTLTQYGGIALILTGIWLVVR